ncbi:DUF2971 domain-containing protein [Brucella sp. 09RB8918]|nr:DUF2971 domain-containing protein [Brucella sp. 09RB8913]MRN58953.1 DUF2971 domain-containing protein [Brucella sp. 09RB8918]
MPISEAWVILELPVLEKRIYKSSPDSLLFHYCSAETLMAICSSKSIRMSDINMMNDYNESQYGYGVFEEAANQILGDAKVASVFPDFNEDFFDQVDQQISPLQIHIHPVIASLSKNPDVLSQWYRYADGGRGFSLGLDVSLLEKMPVTILEVEYDRSVQIKETREALTGIFMRNKTEKLGYGSEFRQECILLGAMLLSFKSSAFAEEQEVRLLHLLDVADHNESPRLMDAGGVCNGRNVRGQPVKYRVSDGAFVAYIDSPFPLSKKHSIIREVWWGPKNENGIGNVVYMMSEYGWKASTTHKSEATFR